MGKNRNRTDLPAAGKEKLQQFRKKKDGQGNSSKPSSKGGKSGRDTDEHDATIGTFAGAAVAPSPESNSRVDIVASDTASSNIEHGTTKVSTGEAALIQQYGEGGEKYDHDAGLANDEPSAKVGVGIAYLSEGADDEHGVDSRVCQEEVSSSLVLEDTINNVPEIVLEGKSGKSSWVVDSADLSSGLEREHGEEQELGSSSGYQIDDGMVKLLDGDRNPPRESGGDNRAPNLMNTRAEEKIHVTPQLGKTGTASSTVSIIGHAGEGSVTDGTSFGQDEDKAEGVNVSGGNVGFHAEGTQASSGFVVVERSSEVENNDNAKSLACKQIDLSSILNGSLVKLSQLAEILQVLDEDEFRCLFMLRGSSLETSIDADKMKANDCVVHDAFERLQEHLYVTSLSKDAYHLQLSEHQKWINDIYAVNSLIVKVQEEKTLVDHQIEKMSEEMIYCKDLIATLQTEIINLNKHITSLAEEKRNLEEENSTMLREYEKQSHDLVEFKVLEAVLRAECCKAFNDLKEARIHIKHLTEENESLNAHMESHMFKAKELDHENNSTQFHEVASQGVKNDIGVLQESRSGWSSREQRKLIVYDDSTGFLVLKRNLEGAEAVMQKLEREIESMHLYMSSLSRSTNEVVARGVSRLVQAFESKDYTDELSSEEPPSSDGHTNAPSSEGHTTEDSLMRIKMVTQILKVLLKELVNDAEDASEFCRVMQSKLMADAAGTEGSKYDPLKEPNDQGVARESELLGLCDALQKQEAILQSENSHLRQKINGFQAQINELEGRSVGFRRDSDDQGLSLCASLETQVHDLQCQLEHLNFVLLEYGNENLVLKHSLKSAQEVVFAFKSQVQEKVAELKQSELRVSSLRERLSIAVTKGKGLISKRESLKQSLADMSKDLGKCSQELLLKDARLHELEAKVKVNSIAGERMEALESELSYIRNSATALRESFLLKDSVLQRIEEILEDLELPEHFHSGDIIEKINWLAKTIGSHFLPRHELDQISSAEKGYSDTGFVDIDGLKEEKQSSPTLTEDLRRRYEELQNSFYGLAEHNEMIEQSLIERNNLVQRWEEILNRVDMPSQLRSMEPEDKIQWLGSALSDAQNHSYSLQKEIDKLEISCRSLTADVEDSQRRTSEIEAAFHKVNAEKEILSKDLEILRQDNDETLKSLADFASRNENLQKEASILQAQKLRLEGDICCTEDAVRRVQQMVKDAVQDSCLEDMVLGKEGVGHFEEMLKKLVEKHKTLSAKLVDVESKDVEFTEKGELSHSEEQDVVTLSKRLEESMGELMFLKEEKDRYMLTNQSFLHELEELKLKKSELEEIFNREENKSASLREKLNVAVRKGKSLVQKEKSLVQQRDGMKQVIEELNAEVERLKSETKHTEKTIYEYEEQIKNLFSARDKLQVMESENSFLRDRLAESKRNLQEKEGSWSSILNALGEIDVGLVISSENPVEWIREIGNYLHDLHGRLDVFEQESRKSKRAAKLLLAELNEVQERNDVLQDELEKTAHELSEVSREKDLAENSKCEALARVEKLSHLHLEEKDKHISEMMVLKSGVDNMKNDLYAIEKELGDVLSKDLEVLCSMKVIMTSFFDSDSTPALGALFPGSFSGGILSTKSENKVFMTQLDSLRERILKHSCLLQEETSLLSEVVANARMEYTSQKEFYKSAKRHVERLQSIEKEKESELHILQGNILLLYETCASATSSLENWKEHVMGNVLASGAPQRNLNYENQFGGNSLTGNIRIFNEESIRSMCDKLLLVVGDSISMQTNELARVMEVGHTEMKSTITNLQKELQEKEIQKDRISNELFNQVKEAETNAKNYLLDLQQARVQLDDSQRQLAVMTEEHKLLEQRMKELQDEECNSVDLQQKVNSLTDALAAKVQECEALMQALDEEEAEMENLANKIVGLENDLHQKNEDSENLEASRAKALKKLSVAVSKFDELHSLSENLLSEVEKLQSQLQEKDGEISFLRQEVTRCTNDALSVAQNNKKSSDEIQDLLAWLDSSISRAQIHGVAFDCSKSHPINEYKEVLQKKIMDLMSELENLRETTQNRNMLLQEERIKVEELTLKEHQLKNSLSEMESQLVLQGVGDSAKATKSASEVLEVEPTTNKWASAGPITPQVRSFRKTNNDQVAIAIDMDDSGHRLEDDDKAHGFKSLTTSKIVPRFTRPVSDMVDGLWMSCDRALMRQPALRLGLMIYWAVLHTMLGTILV